MHGAAGVRTGYPVSEGGLSSHSNRTVREDAGPKGEMYQSGGIFAALLTELERDTGLLTDRQELLSANGEDVDGRLNNTTMGVGVFSPLVVNLLGESVFDTGRVAMGKLPNAAESVLSDEDVRNLLEWFIEGELMPHQKAGLKDSIPNIQELRQAALQFLNSGSELNPALRTALQRFLERDMNAAELLEIAPLLIQVWQLVSSTGPNLEPSPNSEPGLADVTETLFEKGTKSAAMRRSEVYVAAARRAAEARHSMMSEQEQAAEAAAEHDEAELLRVLEAAVAEEEMAEQYFAPLDGEDGDSLFQVSSANGGARTSATGPISLGDNAKWAMAPGNSVSDSSSLQSSTVVGKNAESLSAPPQTRNGFSQLGTGFVAKAAQAAMRVDGGTIIQGSADSLVIHEPAPFRGTAHAAPVKSWAAQVQAALQSATMVGAMDQAANERATVTDSFQEQHVGPVLGYNVGARPVGGRMVSTAVDPMAPDVIRSYSQPELQLGQQTILGETGTGRSMLFPGMSMDHSGDHSESLRSFSAEAVRSTATAESEPQSRLMSNQATAASLALRSPAELTNSQASATLKVVSQFADVNGEGHSGTTEADAVLNQQRARSVSTATEWVVPNQAAKLAYAPEALDGWMPSEGQSVKTESADALPLNQPTDHASKTEQIKASSSGASPQAPTVPPDPSRLSRIIHSAVIEQTSERHTIQLQLEPEALGRLQLRVAMENGAVTAHFVAETEAARRIIEAGIQQLKESLYNHGVDIQEVEVSLGNDGGFGDRRYEQAGEDVMASLPAAATQNKGAAKIEPAPQPVTSSPGGVDVLI